MCCTESYCKCWDKGVKYRLPRAKEFSRYLRWNSTASKTVFLYITGKRRIISSYGVVFDEIFPSALENTSPAYEEEMDILPDV